MSDINVTNNAQESFCEAVDWIVTDAIARHPSDITLDGVITDVSKKANYRYRVKTTEAEFDAYALEGTSYHKNDSVLIHIPMGNFNNQKTILGRKSDGDAVNEIFAFKLPFDDFVALRSLNEEGAIETNRNKAFWANYNSNKYIKNATSAIENESTLNIEIEQKSTADSLDEILLWQWNYGSSNFGTTIGNTRLGIEADWQTFLGDYNPIAGVYGFHIVVTGRAVNQESILTKDYFFTNADMYGNTYAFYTPYSQQKVLDISEFCNIHDVKIYFYQDYNFISATTHVGKIWYDDFKLITENSIEYYVPNMPENILVDNINVFLGITTADIKDEKTYLYSYDPLSYTTIKKRRGIVEGEEHIYIENQNNEWECETTKELLTEENPTDIQTFYECTSDHDLIFTWVHYAKDEGMTFQVVKNIEDLKKQRANSNKDTHIFWYVYNYDNEVQNSDLKLFPYQYWDEEEQVYKFHTEETGYHTNYQEFYDNLIDSRENKSYISKIELYGGEGWTFIPSQTDKFNWENFNPRADKSREKIKVVVQHHGTHTTSEVMVLNNTRDIEQELAAIARNDAFLIKCFKVREVDGKLLAVEDSSLNAFHIYDENNQILHNDQGERYDYEKLYLQIHIKDEDTGTYQLFNTFDEKNATNLNRMISWLIPDNCSMIESQYPISPEDAVYFTNNLQFKDEANNVTSVAGDINIDDPSYKNFYAATRRFTIKSILNNRYQNNIVNAIVTYNNEQYYLQKDLMFGRAEGEGHEFVPVIELIQPYNASNIICDEAFMVGCVVYNKDGSIFRPSDTHLLRFEWKELGQHTYFTPTPNSNSEEDIIFTPKLFDEHKNALIGSYSEMVSRLGLIQENESLKNKYHRYDNNVICGYINRGKDQAYGYSPVFEVTVSGAADYDITVRKAFPIITYPNNASKEQNYIFTVPTRVEFKSDGVKPVYYDSIFSVQQATDDDNQHEEVFNEIILPQNEKVNTDEFKADEWQLKDNLQEDETRIFILQSKLEDTEILTEETVEDGEETTIIYSPKKKYYYTYQLVPNLLSKDGAYANIDEIKRRISWTPELLSNYYYLVWQKDGVYFTQALAFSRSLYSSSLVNEWDGTTLTWDEENGSILSTMIAAGKKDNHNRFTGVMMGDWSTKGDESLDTPGMYGYKDGAQTFGFKTDGSGFIGEAGKGRIEFDGDKALISNSDKTCYMNLNPGANRGYSDNFIYCQIPKTQNEDYFNHNSSGIEYEASWANSYANDIENDYFIVDPHHGILTTGGLIARYGKIGNWMINNEGLYQTTNNNYMYLGVSALDTDTIVKYATYKNDIEQLNSEITQAITQIINNADGLNSNTVSENSIYYDIASYVHFINDKLNEYDGQLKKWQDERSQFQASASIYNTDKQIISGKEGTFDIDAFKRFYNNYIIAQDLSHYELLNDLSNIVTLYKNRFDNTINIDGLKEYLQSTNNNNSYKILIENLIKYPATEYTVTKIKPINGITFENNTATDASTITIKSSEFNFYAVDSELDEIITSVHNIKSAYTSINQTYVNSLESKTKALQTELNTLNLYNDQDKEALKVLDGYVNTYDSINTEFNSLINNYNNKINDINIIIENKNYINEHYSQNDETFRKYLEEYNYIAVGAAIPTKTVLNNNIITRFKNAVNGTEGLNNYNITIKNIITNTTTDVDDIQALYSIIKVENSTDDLIKQFQKDYNDNTASIKTLLNAAPWQIATDNIKIDGVKLDSTNIQNNDSLIEYGRASLQLINTIISRRQQLIFNKYSAKELSATAKQLYEDINNILENISTINDYIINTIDNDILYLVQIITFYNNIRNAIQSKEAAAINNASGREQLIKSRAAEIEDNINSLISILEQQADAVQILIENIGKLNNYKTNEDITAIDKNQDYITLTDISSDLININIDAIKENIADDNNKSIFYNYLTDIANIILNNSLSEEQQNTQIRSTKRQLAIAFLKFCNSININTNDFTVNNKIITAYKNIVNNQSEHFTALINLLDDYAIIVTDQTTYAIYVASKDLTSQTGTYEPYFSVSRNGSMFAKKGIIANTWVIDDSSLTYEKNFAKIYLGQNNNGIVTNYNTQNEKNDWVISAGVINNNNEYNINYGVTLDGQMYAKSGQIGGWYINDKILQGCAPHLTKNEDGTLAKYLQFDAERNVISVSDGSFIIDGSNGSISIGQYKTTITETDSEAQVVRTSDVVLGNLNLASFLVQGRCEIDPQAENTFSYAREIITSQKTDTTSTGGQTYNYGWGSVQLTSGSIAATTGYSSKNISYSLLEQNASYLQFLDQNNKIGTTPVGAVLAVGGNGNKPNNVNSKVTVFYPVNSENNVLGATGHRWDLLANYIDTANLTAGSILCKEDIFMSNGEKVATEPWVRDQLYDVWNAIGKASSAAGAASRASNAASITKAEWIGKQGKFGGYSIGLRFTRGNGSTFDSNATGDLSGAYHGHKVDLQMSGVYLQATAAKYSGNGTTTYGKSINLSHKHDISGSGVDSSGVLTIKWGATNFNSATNSTIDLSSWLRTQFTNFYNGITLQSASPTNNTRDTTITVKIDGPTVFGYTPITRSLPSNKNVLSGYWDVAEGVGYDKGWNACLGAITSKYEARAVTCTGTCTCGESVECTGSINVKVYSIPNPK